MLIIAPVTFVTLVFGPVAPYGRYTRSGWGPQLNGTFAWITMEAPSLLVMLALTRSAGLFSQPIDWASPRILLAAAFLVHYTYRAIIFPLNIRGGKTTPLTVWAMSFTFCCWNGFIQGWSLSHEVASEAVISPRLVVGLILWACGFLSVVHTDMSLTRLRRPGESGYKIPRGGMFELVSAGNYASEMLEWTGFAIAAGTLPAAAFALFTFCNLAPRGVAHHKWYLTKFDDYPKSRKAVIPFLW
ncbi:MAG: hypothetical protein WDW38_009087 [Sanguina aurantia]